jgi:phosphonate transport system permease protein
MTEQKERYHAGFMTARPSWSVALRAYRKDIGTVIADLSVLIALWLLASFIWNDLAHGVRDFMSVPWWVMLVSCFELALVWQSFGISVGMRASGRRRLDERNGKSLNARRLLRIVFLHGLPLFIIPIVVTARYRPWHDVVAGFRPVSAAEVSESRRPWYRTSWMLAFIALAGSMYLASALFTQVDLVKLFTNAGATAEIWGRIFHPDWSILGLGVRLLIVTLFMAFMATFFGVLVAVPLSFLAARNLASGFVARAIYTFLRIVMSIIRSIEPIVWAIIFVVWVRTGSAAFAGSLALFVHSVADLTKLYSERLESIDTGPVEAIRATGATGLQVILYGVVPQIINPYLSFTIYRWDINVRMATIIGLVGGGGIGQRLIQLTRNWVWDQAIVLMLLIMLAVWVMDYSSSKLRERLN